MKDGIFTVWTSRINAQTHTNSRTMDSKRASYFRKCEILLIVWDATIGMN